MRKNVLKLRINATIDIDPTDLNSVQDAAKRQETVRRTLNDQGFDNIEFDGKIGTIETNEVVSKSEGKPEPAISPDDE